MARVIDDRCISCGECAEVCPAEAITEGTNRYVVDPDECMDCGLCEETCRMGAIGEE